MTYEHDERIAIQQEGSRDAKGRPVKIDEVKQYPVKGDEDEC